MNKRDRRMTMLKPSHYGRLRGERVVGRGTVLVLGAAAVVGALVGLAPALDGAAPAIAGLLSAGEANAPTAAAYSEPVSDCAATDGDTIRCGGERIRLLGIDARSFLGTAAPVGTAHPETHGQAPARWKTRWRAA